MAHDVAKGRIFDIQRFCTGDGPGIRTTVFFQGCNLHCPWCHNPESRPTGPLVAVRTNLCLGCGLCAKLPPGSECRRYPSEQCSGCGLCVAECPAGALSLQGKAVDCNMVMETVLRDRSYYISSGGGVTLSGGEPLLQKKFALQLLASCHREGINCAVETAGAVPSDQMEKFIGHVDLWLFDVKAAKDEYKKLIGVDYEQILDNLRLMGTAKERIFLRVPMVAGSNISPEMLAFILECRMVSKAEAVELLPYHALGQGKAIMAGLSEPDWGSMSAPDEQLLKQWISVLK